MATMDPYRMKRATLDPSDAVFNRHVGQVYDPSIMAFRPQRMSLSSTKSAISWHEQEQYTLPRPETRRSSVSSYASLGSSTSLYSTAQTNATSMGSRRSSFTNQQKAGSLQAPLPLFKRLPQKIYTCILQQLKVVHSEQYIQSCATCYMRDLYNLALTSRAWDRAVRCQLYDKIHIIGHDSPVHVKKFKMKSGIRLKLLRRTLRERRVLAQYVHELKVPNVQATVAEFNKETVNLVASIVMACPNLEKLLGFYPTYGHEFDRLTYALSTRRKLREHVWIIGENADITQRSHKQLPPGLMDYEQIDNFLHYHANWLSLSTLVIHSHNQGILEHDIFIEVFRRLPSLRHLSVSSFDPDDFNDQTLDHLPPLLSLRLDSLPGISDSGLSHLASSTAANSIQRLSLIHLPVTSLLIISKLFSRLTSLTRFTLIQPSSPILPPDSLIYLQPIIASTSLSFLHWDILNPIPQPATENLALSIRANGFPSLRTIRAPTDPQGVLQALCKPRLQIVLPSDKYNTTQQSALSRPSTPSSSQPPVQTLYAARQAAQSRLQAARQTVAFSAIVSEDGVVNAVFDFQGFVGTIGSQIFYSLKPDVGGVGVGREEKAVVSVDDLRVGEGEGKDGCEGKWNQGCAGGKKWWWHRERTRWRGVDVEKIF